MYYTQTCLYKVLRQFCLFENNDLLNSCLLDCTQHRKTSIQNEIQRQLQKEAEEFGLSFDFLQSAMNEYQGDKKTIPYLTHLLDSMTLSKEEFEAKTGEKYRRRTKVLEERLQQNFEQLQKWKEEL